MLRNLFYITLFSILLYSCQSREASHDHSAGGHHHDSTEIKDEYVCPMFCDSTVYDKPGQCPVCGMEFEKVKKEKKTYTCPMHPEIIRDQPGQCPICGMDLVERLENKTGTGKLGLGAIVKPVNETVFASVKTTKPERKEQEQIVDALGYIAYNPENTKSIASRYSGRIEKLYVKYNYQPVKKGQKIMEIYSPDLITAQQNYVFLLMNDSTATSLINTAQQKLKLLGMDDNQLALLNRTKKIENTLTIYSPFEGHIHEMNNLKEVSMPAMEMDKNANSMSASEQKEFSVKEGMYIQKGQTIFDVINTSNPWAILKIYPEYINDIKLNQPVEILVESTPHVHYQHKVDYIEPSFEKDSRFIHIRVYMNNSDHHALKIGSLIKAKINTGVHKGLWIPKQSVLDFGNGIYGVFQKRDNVFYIKKVIAGKRINNLVQITEGIAEIDEIAEDAQYLIDSEGFVKLQ